MSRPEISLENYAEMYDFYQDYEQNQRFAQAAHFVMGHVFRPRVTFEDGSKGDSVREAFKEPTNHVILAANHLSNADPTTLLSLAYREDALNPLIGHTLIPTKAPISTQPWYKGGHALRWAVDNLGSIPIYRSDELKKIAAKDHHSKKIGDEKPKIPPRLRELYKAALTKAGEAQATKLKRPGQHAAGFPEGTRNKKDHRQLQKLQDGFAYNITAVANDSEQSAFVLPVGLYYRGEPKDYKKGDVPHLFTPNIHVGLPILIERGMLPEDFNAMLRPLLQGCVDVAVSPS